MTAAMMKRIPAKNARQALLAAWFGFFLVNLAVLLWLYLDNWILEDNFRAALSQLSALYAPYLGGILASCINQSKGILARKGGRRLWSIRMAQHSCCKPARKHQWHPAVAAGR